MAEKTTVAAQDVTRSNVFNVPFELLEIETGKSWSNKRIDFGDLDELGDSILANGIRINLTVVKKKGEEIYIVKDGERRYRAVEKLKNAGVDISHIKFPCVSKAHMAEDESLLTQLISNDGKRFTLLEEASVIAELANMNWTAEEIQARLGKSITHINNCISLIQGTSKKLKDKIAKGQVSATLVIKELKDGKSSEEILGNIEKVQETQSADGKEIKKVTSKDLKKTDGGETAVKDKKVSVKKMEDEIQELASDDNLDYKKIEGLKTFLEYMQGNVDLDSLKAKLK